MIWQWDENVFEITFNVQLVVIMPTHCPQVNLKYIGENEQKTSQMIR